MSDDKQVTALLTRTAERCVVSPPPPVATFTGRAHRRRVARRITMAASISAVVGLVTVAITLGGVGRSSRVSTRLGVLQPAAVFGSATGDALVFDDGGGGVVIIDLDHRIISRRLVDGQIAGDQPWRLTTSGSDLIVGWGQVYAAPLAGGPSRLLGDATISLPATEAGRVWLASWQGGRIGQGALTVREVTTDGRTMIPSLMPNLKSSVPLVGVPGGVAFQTTDGVAIWDATTGTVTQTLGSGQPAVGLPAGNRLPWCDGSCALLHVTTLGGPDLTVSPPQGSTAFDVNSARFSPDGEWLAVVANGSGQSADNAAKANILIINVFTGASRVVTPTDSSVPSLAWAPDGSHLFFSSGSHTTTDPIVGEVNLIDFRSQTVTVPAELGSTFVVVRLAEAHGFVATYRASQSACRNLAVHPKNPPGICGYRF